MQHDLERVGPQGFQDLAAALAIAEFGAHVQALGPGRDGGRDMYTNSTIIRSGSNGQPGQVWQGYTVFQVKHKARLEADQQRNAAWLWSEIRSELTRWADPQSGRNPVPNYLFFITNVPLTPTPGTGGEALINRNIENFLHSFDDDSRDVGEGARRRRLTQQARMGRIRAWQVWDGNQIDALLRVHDGGAQVI